MISNTLYYFKKLKLKLKNIHNPYIHAILRVLWKTISFPATYRNKGIRKSLTNKLFKNNDRIVVHYGPFSGMKYILNLNDKFNLPKLIGSYESCLHNAINELIKKDYDIIINIGSADGYYAVGFAYKMKNVEVLAYELNNKLSSRCIYLAQINNLEDKVKVYEKYDDYIIYKNPKQKILIFCDVDGAEEYIFSDSTISRYKYCDLLIEFHDHYKAKISKKIFQLFKETHEYKIIKYQNPNIADYPILDILSDNEKNIILDESREDINQIWGYFKSVEKYENL
jgi:hypothetical protein